MSSQKRSATIRPLLPTDFDQRFEVVFGLIAFAINRHLMDHMRRIAVELEMDMDTAYVWGTLAHLNVAPALPLGADPSDVLNGQGLLKSALRPVRLADVADVTRLPRETVRRKLEHLRERGKAKRTATGAWQYAAAGVDADTRAFTRETVVRLFRTAEVVLALLDQAELRSDRDTASTPR